MDSDYEMEIPKPENSGSDGTQVKADATSDLPTPQQVGRPMAEAITGLAASNSRAFGGEVASTLIAGATLQMATELEQTRQELRTQRKRNDELNYDLSTEKVKSAVLNERLESFRSSRHLKNIGIAVGSIILATGVQLIKIESTAYGISSLVIGSLLIIISWFSAPKEGDK